MDIVMKVMKIHTMMNGEGIIFVKQKIKENRKLTNHFLYLHFTRFTFTYHKIVFNKTHYWKLSARWLPKMLFTTP